MNIIHATFVNDFGTMLVVAWFDEIKKVYQIQWHGINLDGTIGKKLDYSFDELQSVALQVEDALKRWKIEYVHPD
jgi:hypothetical protein